jgi:hypothetical protein
MLKKIALAASTATLLLVAACGQTTTVEADAPPAQAASGDDRATDRDDGVLENAGEAIDGAGEHVEDSIHDATDDNPNTNP